MAYTLATLVALSSIVAITLQPIPLMAQEDKTNQPRAMTQAQPQLTQPVKSFQTVPPTTPISPSCGQVVDADVKLVSNLNCNTDGIIAGKAGIKINLNGYTITGPGPTSSKVGIMIPNLADVSVIGPGTVQGFQAGLLLTGATGVKADSLILQNNQIAVFSTGTAGMVLNENMIKQNNLGVAAHSTKSGKISTNLITGNELAGVTLVNSDEMTIEHNNILKTGNAIFLDQQSEDNEISYNNLDLNTIDLNNGNGMAPNINNNNFIKNNCNTSNPSGLCIGGQ